MNTWLRRSIVATVGSAILPFTDLLAPATAAAQPPPPCPPGMYWNYATVVCEYPPPPAVYIDPWLPVWVPDIVDANLDFDVDIPVPGPPGIGGPGGPNIGGPRPAPRPSPPRRGGGRR